MGINAIEQNYPYLGLGQLGGVTSGTRARQVQRTGEPQQWGYAAAQVPNGELTPNVGDEGSSHTNGLGHSKHTFNLLA